MSLRASKNLILPCATPESHFLISQNKAMALFPPSLHWSLSPQSMETTSSLLLPFSSVPQQVAQLGGRVFLSIHPSPSYLEKQEAVMPCVWHMQLAKDVSLLLQRAPLAFPSHSRRRKHCLGWILGLLLFMRFPSHHNISINKKSEKRKTAEIWFLSFVFGTEC